MSTLTRLSFDSRPATGANETYFIGLVARTFYYRTDQGRGPAFRPTHDLPGDRSDFKASDIPSKPPRWRRPFAQGTEQHPSHFRRQERLQGF